MIPNGTIYARFRQQAMSLPDQPAMLVPGKLTTTFGELLDSVDTCRSQLHDLAVGRGSRLGILMAERVQTAAAHLVATSTCISVPLNPNMTPDELSVMIQDMGIEAMLVADDIQSGLVECAEASGATIIRAHDNQGKAGLFNMEGHSIGRAADTSYPSDGDVAILLLTSGTTAKPKIVPQTQLNRTSAVSLHSATLEIGPQDRCLNMLPMHHTAGLTGEFLSPILSGASVAFVDFEPRNLVGTVERYRPTWFNLVPSMHQSVLRTLGDGVGVFTNSSLRFARSSSAKLAPDLRNILGHAYGVPIVESYGTTETAYVASTGLATSETPFGSVGRPLHDGVMVANEQYNPMPVNERGEICVTGPTVITGYENNPEANAEFFHEGWYRTGDEGYFDADGFLYVTGRTREIVSRGGEKFSLAEIDEAILRLDGVAEAAAFSAPHPKLGHEIYAAVVPSPGSNETPASLRGALASHLSWAKVPKRIFTVTELPKNSIGKVVRERLVVDLIS